MHPFVSAELSLKPLRDRERTLLYLDLLPQLTVAQIGEFRQMLETRFLHNRGIGLIDPHLIASTLITPGTQLWTIDKRLRNLVESLGIHHP